MKQNSLSTFLGFVEPVVSKPEFVQTSALCQRQGANGPEVLLVSSLNTKRWIIPKGWPMEGHTLAETALQEAWEEAGVVGTVEPDSIGAFSYRKLIKGGQAVTCRCDVFRISVRRLADDFPERGKRMRQWMSPDKAAEAVEEPELQAILRGLI